MATLVPFSQVLTYLDAEVASFLFNLGDFRLIWRILEFQLRLKSTTIKARNIGLWTNGVKVKAWLQSSACYHFDISSQNNDFANFVV